MGAEIFDKLDQHLWRLTYKWARFSDANKSASWVTARYFGKFNKARQDQWVFGDRQSGSYMQRFSWTSIVRHQTVWQGASPDDPAQAEYWTRRRRKPVLPINNTSLWLLKAQDGCCPICKTPLFAEQPQTPSDWAQWLTATRTTITIVKPATGTSDQAEHRLIHAHATARRFCPPTIQQGLLEPDAWKLSRQVLKGAGHSNVPGLPDKGAHLHALDGPASLSATPAALLCRELRESPVCLLPA